MYLQLKQIFVENFPIRLKPSKILWESDTTDVHSNSPPSSGKINQPGVRSSRHFFRVILLHLVKNMMNVLFC